jgi:uncharacterized tellurite resistance protein B-like protein
MINFFKDKNSINKNDFLIKVASLLIHAAKIDETYTDVEEEIVKKTLVKLGAASSTLDEVMQEAKIKEENTNHILEFTKEVKNTSEANKIQIIEALWEIIYSNKDADIYETNLMRRLAGLLYIDNKVMGDIKKRIEKEFSK